MGCGRSSITNSKGNHTKNQADAWVQTSFPEITIRSAESINKKIPYQYKIILPEKKRLTSRKILKKETPRKLNKYPEEPPLKNRVQNKELSKKAKKNKRSVSGNNVQDSIEFDKFIIKENSFKNLFTPSYIEIKNICSLGSIRKEDNSFLRIVNYQFSNSFPRLKKYDDYNDHDNYKFYNKNREQKRCLTNKRKCKSVELPLTGLLWEIIEDSQSLLDMEEEQFINNQENIQDNLQHDKLYPKPLKNKEKGRNILNSKFLDSKDLREDAVKKWNNLYALNKGKNRLQVSSNFQQSLSQKLVKSSKDLSPYNEKTIKNTNLSKYQKSRSLGKLPNYKKQEGQNRVLENDYSNKILLESSSSLIKSLKESRLIPLGHENMIKVIPSNEIHIKEPFITNQNVPNKKKLNQLLKKKTMKSKNSVPESFVQIITNKTFYEDENLMLKHSKSLNINQFANGDKELSFLDLDNTSDEIERQIARNRILNEIKGSNSKKKNELSTLDQKEIGMDKLKNHAKSNKKSSIIITNLVNSSGEKKFDGFQNQYIKDDQKRQRNNKRQGVPNRLSVHDLNVERELKKSKSFNFNQLDNLEDNYQIVSKIKKFVRNNTVVDKGNNIDKSIQEKHEDEKFLKLNLKQENCLLVNNTVRKDIILTSPRDTNPKNTPPSKKNTYEIKLYPEEMSINKMISKPTSKSYNTMITNKNTVKSNSLTNKNSLYKIRLSNDLNSEYYDEVMPLPINWKTDQKVVNKINAIQENKFLIPSMYNNYANSQTFGAYYYNTGNPYVSVKNSQYFKSLTTHRDYLKKYITQISLDDFETQPKIHMIPTANKLVKEEKNVIIEENDQNSDILNNGDSKLLGSVGIVDNEFHNSKILSSSSQLSIKPNVYSARGRNNLEPSPENNKNQRVTSDDQRIDSTPNQVLKSEEYRKRVQKKATTDSAEILEQISQGKNNNTQMSSSKQFSNSQILKSKKTKSRRRKIKRSDNNELKHSKTLSFLPKKEYQKFFSSNPKLRYEYGKQNFDRDRVENTRNNLQNFDDHKSSNQLSNHFQQNLNNNKADWAKQFNLNEGDKTYSNAQTIYKNDNKSLNSNFNYEHNSPQSISINSSINKNSFIRQHEERNLYKDIANKIDQNKSDLNLGNLEKNLYLKLSAGLQVNKTQIKNDQNNPDSFTQSTENKQPPTNNNHKKSSISADIRPNLTLIQEGNSHTIESTNNNVKKDFFNKDYVTNLKEYEKKIKNQETQGKKWYYRNNMADKKSLNRKNRLMNFKINYKKNDGIVSKNAQKLINITNNSNKNSYTRSNSNNINSQANTIYNKNLSDNTRPEEKETKYVSDSNIKSDPAKSNQHIIITDSIKKTQNNTKQDASNSTSPERLKQQQTKTTKGKKLLSINEEYLEQDSFNNIIAPDPNHEKSSKMIHDSQSIMFSLGFRDWKSPYLNKTNNKSDPNKELCNSSQYSIAKNFINNENFRVYPNVFSDINSPYKNHTMTTVKNDGVNVLKRNMTLPMNPNTDLQDNDIYHRDNSSNHDVMKSKKRNSYENTFKKKNSLQTGKIKQFEIKKGSNKNLNSRLSIDKTSNQSQQRLSVASIRRKLSVQNLSEIPVIAKNSNILGLPTVNRTTNNTERKKSRDSPVYDNENYIYHSQEKNNSRHSESNRIYQKHCTDKKSDPKLKKNNPTTVYKINDYDYPKTNKYADNDTKSIHGSSFDINQSILILNSQKKSFDSMSMHVGDLVKNYNFNNQNINLSRINIHNESYNVRKEFNEELRSRNSTEMLKSMQNSRVSNRNSKNPSNIRSKPLEVSENQNKRVLKSDTDIKKYLVDEEKTENNQSPKFAFENGKISKKAFKEMINSYKNKKFIRDFKISQTKKEMLKSNKKNLERQPRSPDIESNFSKVSRVLVSKFDANQNNKDIVKNDEKELKPQNYYLNKISEIKQNFQDTVKLLKKAQIHENEFQNREKVSEEFSITNMPEKRYFLNKSGITNNNNSVDSYYQSMNTMHNQGNNHHIGKKYLKHRKSLQSNGSLFKDGNSNHSLNKYLNSPLVKNKKAKQKSLISNNSNYGEYNNNHMKDSIDLLPSRSNFGHDEDKTCKNESQIYDYSNKKLMKYKLDKKENKKLLKEYRNLIKKRSISYNNMSDEEIKAEERFLEERINLKKNLNSPKKSLQKNYLNSKEVMHKKHKDKHSLMYTSNSINYWNNQVLERNSVNHRTTNQNQLERYNEQDISRNEDFSEILTVKIGNK